MSDNKLVSNTMTFKNLYNSKKENIVVTNARLFNIITSKNESQATKEGIGASIYNLFHKNNKHENNSYHIIL